MPPTRPKLNFIYMEILHWPIDEELKKETLEHYRTNLAIKLKEEDPLSIIHQITFDSAAEAITLGDIKKLFDFAERKFLKKKIAGIGLEVGAGPGTFSSVLASFDSVGKMYAVEVCEPIVELLGPKVAEYILGERKNKVEGVVGSFDRIELPDESVDFVFDFFSLHHSNNLAKTLKECNRILKKGGFIFCFDKARPDYFTQNDLSELLDRECSEQEKRFFGLPADRKLTRRMCGEKEYQLKDWFSSFEKAGFSKIDHFYLAKTTGKRLIKNFISILPVFIQIRLNKLLPEPKYSHNFILSSENKVFSRFVNPFPKEISLLIAYR